MDDDDNDTPAARNVSVEDADRLIDAMALGVEAAFPIFRKFLMKRQEAFYANATYKALTFATTTRRKIRARLLWEEEQRRQQVLAEERRVQAERQLSSTVANKSGRKSKPQREIDCPLLPDGNWPNADELKHTPEVLAATEEEDNFILRWMNKLGTFFGEEGMKGVELHSWRWRKVLAGIREDRRLTEQEEKEEQEARQQRTQPLSTLYEETEDSTITEETEDSTITSTICDTIYSVGSTLVKGILHNLGFP